MDIKIIQQIMGGLYSHTEYTEEVYILIFQWYWDFEIKSRVISEKKKENKKQKNNKRDA